MFSADPSERTELKHKFSAHQQWHNRVSYAPLVPGGDGLSDDVVRQGPFLTVT